MRIRSGILLPPGYQRVEYLASSGTQYIEIPFGFERTDKVEFEFSMDSGQTTDKYMVSPKTWNNNTNRFAMGVHSSRYTCGFGNVSTGSTYLTPATTYNTEKHHWVYENSVFTITDLNLSYNGTNNTFGGVTANLKLFYGYNANTKGKIYSYKHWKIVDNALKLKICLVPCRRISDDVLGLYDTVEGDFYPNAGTGTFTAGADQFSVYDAGLNHYEHYQPLTYIESTGTQYIDTGYVPQSNFKYKFECELTAFYKSGQSFAFLFSSYAASNRYCTQSRAKEFWFQIGSGSSKTLIASLNTRYVIEHNVSTYTVNGNSYSTGSSFVSGGNGYSFQIFADSRYNGNVNQALMKFYGGQIYEGDTLKRDLVPCKRLSDNAIGLYDNVYKTFYPNLGTGTFTAGEIDFSRTINDSFVKGQVRTALLPSDYTQLDYILPKNSSQYIDTSYIPSYVHNFRVEFGFTPSTISKRYCLLSNYNQGSAQLSLEIAADNKARLWLNGGNLDKKIGTVNTTSINTAVFSYIGTTWYVELNGQSSTGSYTTANVPTTTMYMFLDRANRTTTFSTFKLYYCIIYEGGIKIRHFVPCIRKSDSMPGLYDLVNKLFYYNGSASNWLTGNATATII